MAHLWSSQHFSVVKPQTKPHVCANGNDPFTVMISWCPAKSLQFADPGLLKLLKCHTKVLPVYSQVMVNLDFFLVKLPCLLNSQLLLISFTFCTSGCAAACSAVPVPVSRRFPLARAASNSWRHWLWPPCAAKQMGRCTMEKPRCAGPTASWFISRGLSSCAQGWLECDACRFCVFTSKSKRPNIQTSTHLHGVLWPLILWHYLGYCQNEYKRPIWRLKHTSSNMWWLGYDHWDICVMLLIMMTIPNAVVAT